jgi:hypothetical protein
MLPNSRVRLSCVCLLIVLFLPSIAAAQLFPATPVTTAGGRLTVSGEASASLARDDEQYFNYSDYDYDLLRQVRFDGAAAFRVNPRVSLLGDVRVEGPAGEGSWRLRPYALFVRVRPWPVRAFDVQAGLIPPVFGAFSRHAYGADNPLIGFPLAYQYVTSLRPDALPASADDLLRMRGHGWRADYPIGDLSPNHGVPLVDGLHYQTGVEVHAGNEPVEASASLTSGSLSVPGGESQTGSVQVSGRLAYAPVPGLRFGASASRSRFLSQSVLDALGPAANGSANTQTALGADVEYSFGYWLLRSEAVFSSWRIPAVSAPVIRDPLRAFAVFVEGRYRISPGLYVAARGDRLDFSDLTGSVGTQPWEAPVRRVEVGGGYSVSRNVLLKLVYQYNWRLGVSDGAAGLAAAQLLFWF